MGTIQKISKGICLGVLLFAGVRTAEAQYDAMFTQYMFNEMFINPAYAGSKDAMSVTGVHRQQWVNFPGRPVTTTFSMHGPLMGNKMGLGLSVLNEKIGVLNRNLAYLSYAYRVKTGKKGNLAFGLQGGIHQQVNKFASLKMVDAGDVQVSQNSPSILSPNFGTGIYFNTQKFYAGVSIPRLIDDRSTISISGDVVKITKLDPKKFHYYLTAGYVFHVSEGLKIKPQAMVKAVQNAPLEYEGNLNFLLKEKIWVGASYRSSSDVSGILGVQVSQQFVFSYSYDFPLTQIRTYTQGSHELVLSYLFSYKTHKIVTPRYF